MRTGWLILVLSLILVRPGVAAPRPVDEEVDYQLSAGVSRKVLPNGLTVLIKSEPRAQSVALEVLTRVGPAQEDNTTSGIVTLVGNLMERRLSKVKGKDDDLMDRTGSDAHVNVSLDYTELSVATSADHAQEVLKRLLQAYGQRPFDADEVDDERKKLVKQLDGGEGDFNSVYDLFLEVFYRYHPYRQPLGGNPVAVRRMTADMVNAFIDRWYAPNRTIVCVVGNVDPDIGDSIAKSSLGALKPVPENTEVISWEAVSTEKEIQLVSLQRMAFLFLGSPAPSIQSEDYPAMRVLNAIVGSGISSRMWVDLREERGLAYELGSEYPTLEGPSHFLSFVVTNPKQVHASRHQLLGEMDRIRNTDVSPEELEYGKWKTVGALMASIETPQGQAAQLASTEAQGVGYQFTDRFIDSVWRVSAADVRNAAKRYLDNYTLLVARPPGTEPLLPDHL